MNAFIVLLTAYAFATPALRSRTRDVPAVRKHACETALGNGRLTELLLHLGEHGLTEDDRRLGIRYLREYGAANPRSRAYVSALVRPPHHDSELDENLPYVERLAMAQEYLDHPDHAALAAEFIHVYWQRLLLRMPRDPGRLNAEDTDFVRSMFTRMVALANKYPREATLAWETGAWSPGRTVNLPFTWDRGKLEVLIAESTHQLRTLRSHDFDANGEIMRRAEYVRRLMRALRLDAGEPTLRSFLRLSLPDDETLLRQNLTYASDMTYVTGERDDKALARPYGLYLIALHHRMTQVIQRASRRRAPASFAAFNELLASWDEAEAAAGRVTHRWINPAYALTPDQAAVVRAVAADPTFKATLFAESSLLNELKDPRAWLSVLEPARVRAAVSELVVDSPAFAQFKRALRASLGIDPDQLDLDPRYYAYYPDEVWDAIPRPHDARRTVVRYARRATRDLSLGTDTGDFTAVGRENHANSLTWFYNSAYQIIFLQRDGRTLAKLTLGLFDVGGRPSLLIDATEVHPRAQREDAPYRPEAQKALLDGLHFVRDVARRLGRDLYALPASNTAWINEFWAGQASEAIPHRPPPTARYLFDAADAHRALRLAEEIHFSPYYQVVEFTSAERAAFGSAEVPSEVLRDFKTGVITPAPALGPLLSGLTGGPNDDARADALTRAARLILADPGAKAAVRRIFGIPDRLPVDEAFVVTKLGLIYPAGDADVGRSGGFPLPPRVVLIERHEQ